MRLLPVALGLIVVLAAFGWGWALLTVFGCRTWRDKDRLLAYPLAGIMAAALVGSVLWMTGGFAAPVAWFGVVGGLCLAVGAAVLDGKQAIADFRRASVFGPSALVLWGCAAVLCIPTLLAPDTSWDSNAYHLIFPRHAACEGALPLTALEHPMGYVYWTTHTLLGWGYLLAGAGEDIPGRLLLAVTAALGIALATRRIGRRFHPRVGLVALGLLLATPVWLSQWGTAMVDVTLFAWSACGLALATDRDADRRTRAIGYLALAVGAAATPDRR